ncbi:TerD family protein [Streptomyces sp. NPDC059816]|uniref:TerD family protein n=1 Tax=Streptomyces sp. NPDC059816 TaxID=3346960 RepID=UPI00365C5CC1
MGGLVKGGNTYLPSAPLRIAVRHGLDATALLLNDEGAVRGDGDIVFHGQPEHPSGAVRLTGEDDGTEWLEVDLPTVEPDITRVLLVGSTEVGTLRDVTEPSVEAFAPDGTSVVRYEVTDAADETALVFAELYRRAGGWKFRAVGQGYADGLTGLARDHGVDVAEPGVAPSPVAAYPVEWTFGTDFAPYVVVGRDKERVTVPPYVPPGPVLLELAVEGDRPVDLELTDEQGRLDFVFVSSYEPDFRGRFLATVPDVGPLRLRVDTEGLWRLRVLPLSHARRLGEAREGHGPEVLLHTTGPTALTLRHQSTEDVILNVHPVDGTGLADHERLINEFSGGYRGTVQLPGGPLLVDLSRGEGRWTMAVDDPAAVRDLPAPPVAAESTGAELPGPFEVPSTLAAEFTPFMWTDRGHAQVTVAPDVPPGPAILELIVQSGKRVSLHTLNEHGYSAEELLDQWQGDGFRGRFLVVVPADRPLALGVGADGDWRLRVLPLSHARRLDEAREGHGPEVLVHTTGPADLTFHHRGQRNVVLWSRQVDGAEELPHPELLLNEAGERVDTVPLHRGPVILALSMADCDWSTTLDHVLWPVADPAPRRVRELPTAPAAAAPPVTPPQEFGPVFAPFAVTGQRSSVITVPPSVPAGPVIVELAVRGNGYTGLHVLDRHNAEREALVSSTHPGFRGRVLTEVPDDGPLRLSLKAEHGWKLRVLPLTEARHLGEPLTGNGPEVLWHTAGAADLTVQYQGEDDLIADLIEVRGRRDLPPSRPLIDKNGRRQETVPLPEGPALVEFTRADGPWTVELRNVRPPSAAPADVLEPVPTRHHAPGTTVDTMTGGVRGWLHGPVFTPFATEGRGERVITVRNVPAGPVLLEFSHEGDGYVECMTLSRWNREEDHVFSTSLSQVRLTALATSPKHRPLRMRIQAQGSWTLRVLPLSAARELSGTLTGEAPEVLRYSGPAADLHLDVKTRRGTYTLLRGYEVEGTSELPEGDTLISEDGGLSAITPLPRGPLLLQFEHVEGVWTMTAHPTVSKS